jgi:S-adenosylmethionine:tRNA-ribosyltransferase-isomerase (queuine synthetase)
VGAILHVRSRRQWYDRTTYGKPSHNAADHSIVRFPYAPLRATGRIECQRSTVGTWSCTGRSAPDGIAPQQSSYHTYAVSCPTHFLAEGDVVVINTSGTLNAALDATRPDGTAVEVHLSTHLPADLWLVELCEPWEEATRPLLHAQAGEIVRLPAGGTLTLLTPYGQGRASRDHPTRLWVATLALPDALHPYLQHHGFPIHYQYVGKRWSADYYQTVYATEMGSAEMPSARRAFTTTLITDLVARGVAVVPLVLHTGVASLETHEPPYEEWYRVPIHTAQAVNQARANGRRIVGSEQRRYAHWNQ